MGRSPILWYLVSESMHVLVWGWN